MNYAIGAVAGVTQGHRVGSVYYTFLLTIIGCF